jgi:hypothetical protein
MDDNSTCFLPIRILVIKLLVGWRIMRIIMVSTQPTAAISAAGIRVCAGVRRSDSLDKLMQEECVHFRVGAKWRGNFRKAGPLFVFLK